MLKINTKLQYHSERPGGMCNGDIFTVSHIGKFKTTLKPKNEGEFNPRFKIDNTDLQRAIKDKIYTITD